MNSIYLKKLLNLFNYFLLNIFLAVLKNKRHGIKNRTLLLIRLDSIGDYVLFRNFLESVRESEKYRDYNITLCGNIIWKDLAETFDKDYVDHFIWLNRKKFYSDFKYKFKFLRNVYKSGYETVIDTTYGREILYGDAIVRASEAKVRIGSTGSREKHVSWKRRMLTDKYYTKLIPATDENIFELFRNKEFFEVLLDKKLNIKQPQIDPSKLPEYKALPDKYCVIFPGSNDPQRRWSASNYAEICEYLISEFGLHVVIPLSGGEKYIADEISRKVKSKKLIDLSGKCSLTELAKIIADSEMVISNDTAAVHISAAVNKRFLCISNGSYFGRFLPYPEAVFPGANYLFPDEVLKDSEHPEKLAEKYRINSPIDINSISVEIVKNKIEHLLK